MAEPAEAKQVTHIISLAIKDEVYQRAMTIAKDGNVPIQVVIAEALRGYVGLAE